MELVQLVQKARRVQMALMVLTAYLVHQEDQARQDWQDRRATKVPMACLDREVTWDRLAQWGPTVWNFTIFYSNPPVYI